LLCLFRKNAFAIVQEEAHPCAQSGDQQIEITVAIDIDQDSSGAVLVRAGHTGVRCDIFEFPVSEVSVKNVWIIETAKVNVATPVAINIAQSDSRATEQVSICDRSNV